MIQDSEDPNVRALLEIPYIGGNEKIGVSVLLKLAGDISAIGADIDGIARNRGRELATLPSHVWNDPRYEAQFLAVFKAQGELFQYAPRAIRNDQPWVMKVMKVNAGAYAHISERMQDDPEVLYRAINSDKRLSGEFYWKNVGPVLKLQLKANGIKGIPSADDLLQVLLGLEKEKPPLTSDTVDSLIGDWTEVQKNDPLRVTRYLQIHRDHPEYFLDVGDKLRSDFTFIGKITKEMPLIFDQLDHEALYRANPKGYIQFAAELYKSGFQLYLKIPDALRNQDAFYTAVVKASRLIKSATSSTPPAKPGKPKPRTPPLE
jgi:hypothetical protein